MTSEWVWVASDGIQAESRGWYTFLATQEKAKYIYNNVRSYANVSNALDV